MSIKYKLWMVAGLISALALPAYGQIQEEYMPSRAVENTQTSPQAQPTPPSGADTALPAVESSTQSSPTLASPTLASPTLASPVTPAAPSALSETAPSTQPTSPAIATDTAQQPASAAASVDAPPATPDVPPAAVAAPPPVSPPSLDLPSSAPTPVPTSENNPNVDNTAAPSLPNGSAENNNEPPSDWPSMIVGEGGTVGEASESPVSAPVFASNQSLPQDLSPYGMFMQADFVVKSVMILLASASLLTWVIWLAKSFEICMAKRRVTRAVKAIIAARSLAEAIEVMSDKKGVSMRLVAVASEEVRVSLGAVDGAGSDGLKERINSHLHRIEVKAGRVMSRGTGLLATIGAVAPFVGLFGTVWGIMNSFIGISHAQTTNLAVVAPGIAEALLATAIGLVAAIPAVVIFNMFARSITVYRQMLGDVSAAIERLVSRDLDFRLAHKRAGKPVLSTAAE